MARPRRDAQTIARQLDDLVEELKDVSGEPTKVTPEVIPEAIYATEDEPTAEEITTYLAGETPQINIIEPSKPEAPALPASTIAEMEAGRAALAKHRG